MINRKLLKLRIKKSNILILLPLSICIIFVFTSIFVSAGKKLTPYSVSVSGYTKSDGTYVSSHSRRPPGATKYDVPYANIRLLSLLFILMGYGLFGYSCYYFRRLSKQKILLIIQYEVAREIKSTFNTCLPKRKSFRTSQFYYMDNYSDYNMEEKRFINEFIVEFKNKTDIDFDNIEALKKIFKEQIIDFK